MMRRKGLEKTHLGVIMLVHGNFLDFTPLNSVDPSPGATKIRTKSEKIK